MECIICSEPIEPDDGGMLDPSMVVAEQAWRIGDGFERDVITPAYFFHKECFLHLLDAGAETIANLL